MGGSLGCPTVTRGRCSGQWITERGLSLGLSRDYIWGAEAKRLANALFHLFQVESCNEELDVHQDEEEPIHD